MPIGVDCPACQHQFMVPDKMSGRPVKCPRCEHPFTAHNGPVGGGGFGESRLSPAVSPPTQVPIAHFLGSGTILPVADFNPPPEPLPVAQVVGPPVPLPAAKFTASALPVDSAPLPAPAPLDQVPLPVAAPPAPPLVQPAPVSFAHGIMNAPSFPAPAKPKRRGLTRLVLDLPDTVMRSVPKPLQGITGLAFVALLAGLAAWAVLGLVREQIMALILAVMGLLFAGVAIAALVQREAKGFGLPFAAVLVNLQALVLAFVAPATSQPTGTDQEPSKAPATPIALLRGKLKDADPKERMKAAYAVRDLAAEIDKTVPDLLTLLGDKQAKVRAAAIEALGQIGPEARIAYPLVADKQRSDPDDNVRNKAKDALKKIGAPTAADVAMLQGVFTDKKSGKQMRVAAALSLALIGNDARGAIQPLEEGLKDSEGSVRVASAHALWKLIGRQAEGLIEVLIAGLRDVDVLVKAQAAQVLFEMRVDARDAAGQLEIALGDSDTAVRQKAAMALWSIGPAANAQVPRLLKALDDSDTKVKIYAAMALWGIARQKEGIAVLCVVLNAKGEDLVLRVNAAKGLWSICKDARNSNITMWDKKLAGKPQIADAVGPLIKALEDSDSDVRGLAALTLGFIGKDAKAALPKLTQSLKHPADAGFRAEVAFALMRIGLDIKAADPKALDLQPSLPALAAALEDADGNVRLFAAQALWAIERKGDALVPVLIKLLQDRDAELRAKAADALGALRQEAKAAVPALNDALKDENPKLRLHAATTLGKIGQEARVTYPTLEQLTREDQPEIKKAATEAMKKIGRPVKTDVKGLLIPALKHPSSNYRAGATACLWMLDRDARDAVEALAEALSDTDPVVSNTAAFALAAIGPEADEAVPALIKALSNQNDEDLRMHAAYALGEIGAKPKENAKGKAKEAPRAKKDAPPALKAALDDKRPSVRLHAAKALWEITHDPQDVLEALTFLLEEKDVPSPLVLSAVETLTEVGPKCGAAGKHVEMLRKHTVPALTRLMADGEDTVKLTAVVALGVIGKEGRTGVPRLIDMLSEPDAEIRAAAIEALVNIAAAEQKANLGIRAKVAYAALLFAWKADSNEAVRQRANLAKQRLQPGAADVPELLDVIGDKSQSLAFRQAAAQVLGLVGQDAKGHVERMCKLLTADEPGVRALVALALGELGLDGKTAIRPLIAALKDQDGYVRVAVVQALGEIGQFHRADCLEDLRLVSTNDPDAIVREAAAEAVKKIVGAPK
jgi:predicted Zn finger-like uncharacterized protein